MNGFRIAVATKDKTQEDLIILGTDKKGDGEESSNDIYGDEASVIQSVDIFFDTTDNNVKQKSGSMLARVEIKGKIPKTNPKLMKMFRKISEWSHDRKAETQYRNICIAIKDSDNSFHAVYKIENVFVVDYREVYRLDDEGKDEFELRLTQRENNMDKIDILSDWPANWEWARKG